MLKSQYSGSKIKIDVHNVHISTCRYIAILKSVVPDCVSLTVNYS